MPEDKLPEEIQNRGTARKFTHIIYGTSRVVATFNADSVEEAMAKLADDAFIETLQYDTIREDVTTEALEDEDGKIVNEW